MNSSCLKVLVSWLRQLGEVAEAKQYTVCFLASGDIGREGHAGSA
jgi:hypothetical protein